MEKKETLCEIIGIILGDGYLRYDTDNYRYSINISLNGIDDYDYYQYVKKLLSEFFQRDLSEIWYKDLKNAQGDEKGVTISIYSKELVQLLLEKGLLAGDKVKSGVCVPDWIKLKDPYILKCLKGLVDTDGYIGVVKSKNSKFSKIIITFTSRSKNLARDFKQLSKLVKIRCSNVNGPYETFDSRTKKIYKSYSVTITAKDQVQMFIRKVNPKKWEYRKEIIGIILNLYKNPLIYESIKKELGDKFGKLNLFTKDQQGFLRNQLQSKNINITTQNIEDAINTAFSYKKIHYTYRFAEELKDKLISLGSLREVEEYYNSKKGGQLNVYRKSIIQYLEKLFTQELKYKNLYNGLNGFRKWKSFNFDILVKKQNDKVSIYRFPFFLKKKLCNRINQIIGLTKNNELVYSKLKFIIENEDLNGNIITDKNSIYVKKYERIAFLLNDPRYKSAIQFKIKLLIEVVNEFKSLSKKEITMKIGELSFYLRKKFNLKWKPENLKKVLDELNLYEQLISEDKLNETAVAIPSFKIEEEDKPSKYDKKISNNNEKNTFSNSYSSKPFPYNKPRGEDLADEDFSDPYLWFSPQVREAIQSKAESLIEQVHEGVSTLKDFSDPWEEVSIYDRSEFESDSAEEINDTPEGDIIPDQDIEPNSEISEIQDHNDVYEPEINNTDKEIDDSISEQQELIEDEIRNFEQINYSEKREGDLRPDNFNPILQPVYDPLFQPITELIPPPEQLPESSSNPQDINTPQPENEPEPQNYPPNQQEQEEISQVPEKSQEEVGTEPDIEEISDNSNIPDIESVINEPIEETQDPEPSVSGYEDSSDKTDIGQEDSENANQEESKNSPNPDEKDEDSDKDKDEKEEIKDKKDDDKDDEKEKDDKDESDDENEEMDDENNEPSKDNDDDSKEDEEESDDEGQEEDYDDMDDLEEDSERGFDPTDMYDPINVIDYSELYPQIPTLHSSSIDHPLGDIQIIDGNDFREPFCDIKIGGEDFQEGDITEVPHFTSEGFTDDLLNNEINDANLADSFKDML